MTEGLNPVEVQQRMIQFITRANWLFFAVSSALALTLLPRGFALGILAGGLIITVNFHLLARTLRKTFKSAAIAMGVRPSHNVVLAKYYLRFAISGLIIFFLISKHFVDPLGLLIGLSVVVASIMTATLCELTKQLFFKEAV